MARFMARFLDGRQAPWNLPMEKLEAFEAL
jgi:hypothetical protein